jgi:hypothetical protein
MSNIKILQNVTIYNSITSLSSITTAEIDGRNNKLTLKPDPNIGTDQYVIIEPTSPTDIHIRAGGNIDSSSADLFIGGENTYLKVSDSADDVYIKTTDSNNNGLIWTFDNDGTLTLPLTADIKTNSGRSIINDPVANTLTVNTSGYVLSSFTVGDTSPISGATFSVKGKVVIDGSLIATGSATFVNTTFTTTSSLSIVNVGTGPGLVVRQEGDQAVAAFYDHENGIGLWIDGDASRPGYVGIKTTAPNKALTVVGDISATGRIYTDSTINKFVSTFGDGTNIEYVLYHNLGVEDVVISIVDTATKEVVYPSVTQTALNEVKISFADAPSSNAYKAIIIG